MNPPLIGPSREQTLWSVPERHNTHISALIGEYRHSPRQQVIHTVNKTATSKPICGHHWNGTKSHRARNVIIAELNRHTRVNPTGVG
jgi:hypothetical protein